MSRMIRINDGCYVAADLIAEIKVNSSSSTITVRMKDGIGHCHSPNYKQTVYAALDALIAEVNSALSPLPAAPKAEPQPISEKMVSKMARILSERFARDYDVDIDDHWTLHGTDLIEDVHAMLDGSKTNEQ